MDHYDVIIIGGGPSGSAAGYVLAKGGKSVLIIDKEKFPRKKLCGGMVTEKTIKLLLDVFGKFDYSDIIDYSYDSFGIFHSKIAKVCKYSHPTRKTHFVHRVVFDNYLLNKAKDAGCQTLEADKVLSVAQMSQLDYKVATKSGKEFSCNYIIGADGANSIARKSVTSKTVASRYTIAIEIEVAYEDLKCFGKNEQPFPQIYFGCINHGYGWVFPKKDFVVVGAGGIVCRNKENFKDIFDTFLKSLLKDDVDTEKYVVSGFPVPFHNFIGNISKDNIFLVGDAAGFVEPITGEGIYYAILSGKCAAESILNEKNDYAKVIGDKFGKHLRQANIVKALFFCKPILSYAMKKMKSNAKYCKYYFDVLAGEIDYFGYIKAIIRDRKKYYSE